LADEHRINQRTDGDQIIECRAESDRCHQMDRYELLEITEQVYIAERAAVVERPPIPVIEKPEAFGA
jgi:hypothetical protein